MQSIKKHWQYLFIGIITTVFSLVATAQSITIGGYVKDASSKEALIGASVASVSNKVGTKTLVYISSIDKNAFDFFNQLDKQKLAQFNPFVEPVFLKDGQFGTKAIGYFAAMQKSNSATFIYLE